MQDGQPVTIPLARDGGPAEEVPDGACLLVIEAGSSALRRLPEEGELTIGRAPDVQVRLQDPAVSRVHARLQIQEGRVTLIDLGSQNGTRVNGEPIGSTRVLQSGDVLTLCDATILFYRPAARGRARPVLPELQPLRARLEEEVERSRLSRRGLVLFCLELGEGARARRGEIEQRLAALASLIDVMAWAGPQRLLILRPDCDEQDAQAAASSLVEALAIEAPLVRVGFTSSPADGYDPNALLEGAMAAAERAQPGRSLAASAAGTTLRIGDREILLADQAMLRLYSLVERLAASDLPVLILGETGVGKELAAQALHARSPRRAQKLVALNCAALPESLAESELFGHERGAFSGAVASKPGLLEAASGGTVFLDEVGELSLTVQAKLLRAFEVKRITRVGDVRERPIDIRLIAATNRDLADEVKKGRFRQDLYFRLGSAVLALPPLRDRPQELSLLARRFLAEACARLGREPMLIAPASLDLFRRYRWPGNIRELRSVMEYAATVVTDGVLQPEHLPEAIQAALPARSTELLTYEGAPLTQLARALLRMALPNKLEAIEEAVVREALAMAGGNKSAAARLLGVHRKAVERRVDRKSDDS